MQEFLNRSPDHLWAIVSNGLRLRLLRDNQALSRQSFLEFDLEAMFAGEVYSDFVLLWLMAHATRFAPRDPTGPTPGSSNGPRRPRSKAPARSATCAAASSAHATDPG